MTRADRITLGLSCAVFAAWAWFDAFITVLERTS